MRKTKEEITKKRNRYWLIMLIALFVPYLLTGALVALYYFNILNPPIWTQWVMFGTFIPLIILTLIVHQRNKLAGPYGETILILIPTFVWLLGGADSSIKWLVYMSGIIVGTGLVSFIIAMFFKKGSFTKQVLVKLALVASAVVSTVTISVVLLNWGDKAVHLAGEVKKDYASRNWIIFIAVVTVASALLLVFIGLLTTFENVNIDRTQISFVGRKRRKRLQKKRDHATQVIQLKKLKKEKAKKG